MASAWLASTRAVSCTYMDGSGLSYQRANSSPKIKLSRQQVESHTCRQICLQLLSNYVKCVLDEHDIETHESLFQSSYALCLQFGHMYLKCSIVLCHSINKLTYLRCVQVVTLSAWLCVSELAMNRMIWRSSSSSDIYDKLMQHTKQKLCYQLLFLALVLESLWWP